MPFETCSAFVKVGSKQEPSLNDRCILKSFDLLFYQATNTQSHTHSYEIIKKLAPVSSVAVLATRNPQLGEAAAKQLREKDGLNNVVYKPLDLNSPESIRDFANSMEKDYGRVDTLVNNAGIIGIEAPRPV